MQLLMLKIGATPPGRLIEQHDVMFVAAKTLGDVLPAVNAAWCEVRGKWHIDAWRTVTRVGDYSVALVCEAVSRQDRQDSAPSQPSAPQLFFINLGGYLPNQFDEYHHKLLIVADSRARAIAQAKTSAFYHDYSFINSSPTISGVATSHVDNQLTLDVDNIHNVQDLLAPNYRLHIRKLTPEQQATLPHDDQHIGYLSLKQLRALRDANAT